jgi:membrane protein YdbS with pleckstrin-like domain
MFITRTHHGILSLLMLLMAIVIGALSVFKSSVVLTVAYLGASMILFMVVIYSYCSKCPCRLHSCAHILPGKLTTFLPSRKVGQYTALDFLGVTIPLVIIFAFPQLWLIKNLFLLIVFWALVIVALVEIRFSVCKGCGNNYCPLSNG